MDSATALTYWRPIAATADSVDTNGLVAPLLQCLNSSNAELRDDIGYGLFSSWLRNERLTTEQQQFLLQQLSNRLIDNNKALSLQRSFSALVISELLRADAKQPFMNAMQYEQLLQTSIAALYSEQDYRGWEADIGWVHPIAHMADVMWRFTLHPKLTDSQAQRILAAVHSKASTAESFYHFNEGDRLARPVAVLLRRDALTNNTWLVWLESFDTPNAANSWPEVFATSDGLTELHNTKLFIRALATQLQGVELNSGVQQKLDELLALLASLV